VPLAGRRSVAFESTATAKGRCQCKAEQACNNRQKNGDLKGCLQALQDSVRKNPADSKLRIFLAQVMMIQGDWDRALNQLKVIGEMEASALPMMHAYSSAIHCEKVRADVFAGTRSPLVFGDPVDWIALQLRSLALQGTGREQDAAKLREQAFELAPATSGTINGEAFEWIADADSRLGPVLEVLLNEAYYWIPFERIARVTIEAPSDARDLVWVPAEFQWTNGGEAMGLIPTRYPGSDKSEDAAIRLARKTEWSPAGPDAFTGLGQRLLTTDGPEIGLLELRELLLQPAA
jgi:type VI secretion system protein ImpE